MPERDFLTAIQTRVVIFDGGMGATLQKFDLSEDDFQGHAGCNEILNVSRPDVIKQIHAAYFEAGADAVETNTFGANRVELAEHGLADRARGLNAAAARLARETAADFSGGGRARFTVGSIGPGSKQPTLGYITFDELADAYEEQAGGLIEGGADALLIETCVDPLQTKSAIVGCERAFAALGKKLPLMAQVTIERGGLMLTGSDIETAHAIIDAFPSVNAVGINCSTGPAEMEPHIRRLAEISARPVSCLPNAGLPEEIGGKIVYPLKPSELAEAHRRFITEYGVNIIGGCCGTTADHIRAVSEACANLEPARRTPARLSIAASCYASVGFDIVPSAGKKTAAEAQNDLELLNSALSEGAMPGRDFPALIPIRAAGPEGIENDESIKQFIKQVGKQAARLRAPILLDCQNPVVLEAALKKIPGKPVIGPVDLNSGEKALDEILSLGRRYGAAVLIQATDKIGPSIMADELNGLLQQIKDRAANVYDLPINSLFFNLVLDEESEKEILNAIKNLKAKKPRAFAALTIKAPPDANEASLKQALEKPSLNEAAEAGLDLLLIETDKCMILLGATTGKAVDNRC